MRRVAKKDSAITKTHVQTNIENCSCSLFPNTVQKQSVVHDFNAIVNNVIPFSVMTPTEFLLRHTWADRKQFIERNWKTRLKTKGQWEEKEAIRRLKLEML